MTDLQRKFHTEMINIYQTTKNELKYNATRFLQLVLKDGGVSAAKQLIIKDDPSYGFQILSENNRLDLSVEALALKEEYHELFSEDERRQCREKLKKYNYIVNEY